MPLGFATIPLDPAALRALADAGYGIIDAAARTPGLLIVQAPDEAGGERREAGAQTAQTESPASPQELPPSAQRPAPVADGAGAAGA